MTDFFYQDHDVTLHQGDAATVLASLPEQSANCVVTSPPYFGLRDYGVDGQLGLEASPAEYVAAMVDVFRGVRRVLRDDGVAWLNLGDSYASKPPGNVRGVSDSSGLHGAQTSEKYRETLMKGMGTKRDTTGMGLPEKNLMGMPWRVSFALQDDGWTLRNAVIWHKPNAMPESVTDRLSTRYEHVFLFSKSRRYWFDLDPIREQPVTTRPEALTWARDSKEADVPGQSMRQHRSTRPYMGHPPGTNPQSNMGATGVRHDNLVHEHGRNPGDVWTIPTSPYPGAHFATMPPALARRCILAGCPEGGTVLDPFTGSGTTGMVARQLGRKFVGIDLNPAYLDLAVQRIGDPVLDFGNAS